jgi:predicted PurR-regulated permease PerM
MGIILTACIVFVAIAIYVIRNLLRKVENLEDLVLEREEYTDALQILIKNFMSENQEVLEKYKMEDDSELGDMFKSLIKLQETLKSFTNK